MHEAIKRRNALIVFDDPISSFDYDKRYGILYALFSKNCTLFKENLFSHTVLVLTHDQLILNDLIAIKTAGIRQASICGQYITCSADGMLESQVLDKNAIAPFTQQLLQAIENSASKPKIIVYAKVRQLCELLRKNSSEKQTKYAWTFSLLSDILHGRTVEETLAHYGWGDTKQSHVKTCENLIKKLTKWDIDYWEEVEFYSDCTPHLIDIYQNGNLSAAEKLLVVRLLHERNGALLKGSEIMKRFATEACHIGGNYLFQLNGEVFDQVPFYVTEWCDRVVAMAELEISQKS